MTEWFDYDFCRLDEDTADPPERTETKEWKQVLLIWLVGIISIPIMIFIAMWWYA